MSTIMKDNLGSAKEGERVTAAQDVRERLCKIMSEITSNHFLCFCGNNLIAEHESFLREIDEKRLMRAIDVLRMFQDEILNGEGGEDE